MTAPLPPEGGLPLPQPLYPGQDLPTPDTGVRPGAYSGLGSTLQRFLLAQEEFRAAYRSVVQHEPDLPPPLVPWDTEVPVPVSQDPITRAIRDTQHETESFLLDMAAAGAGPSTNMLTSLTAPPDPDSWLVGNFIRPGTTVMLTGPPGSSKSWAARQLAMAAAAGLDTFLGAYVVERPLNVLVIDEDNGPKEEWRRDETLLAHLELERSQLGSLRRVSLEGVQLDQEIWQHWLRGQIRMDALDLVILDPISEMHGGKELREDPAFRSLLGFLKRLKVDFPALATMLVHHTRKVMPGTPASSRGLDDVRGQWGQTPDVVALLWPLGERRAAWELHKRVPHSKLILEATAAGPLVMVADETTVRNQRMETDDKVLAAIEGGLERAADIQTGTGLSKSAVFKTLARLAEAGIISKRAPYQLLEGD